LILRNLFQQGTIMNISRLLSATALAGSLCVAPSAFAQTNTTETAPTSQTTETSPTSPAAAVDQADQQNTSDETIVVTGSRIRVSNKIDAAVPIVSLTAAELLGTRGDVSLGDSLNQLPQLRSTFSQANSTGSIGTAGLSLLDLRGLGTARTLTLVNGRRVVSAVPGSYTPDVSTIPYDLVQQVDLVTGGQSAIYGSDAIAGVVNFILRRDYEGFRLRGQGGITTYGDRGSYLISGLAGHSYLDGRLNVTVSAEYTRANSLFYADRDYLGAYNGTPGFITSQITNAPNRNFDGIPNTVFVPRGIKFSNLSLGGAVQTVCPAATATNAAQVAAVCTGQLNPTGGRLQYYYLFGNDGSLIRNDPSQGLVDSRNIGGGVLGGLTATGVEDAMLLPSQDRFVTNLLINGDFSPAFRPFIEASYAKVKVEQQSTQPTFINGTLSPTFSVNNGFLTPAARNTLTTILNPGATTFTLFRFNNDLGTRSEFHTRETFRAVAGVGGDFSSHLRYEVAGNFGRTDNFYRTGGNVIVANYNRATNAVLAPATFSGSNFVLNGQGQRVVCGVNADASTANDDAACFPLNVFGVGNGDPRALDYVLYTSTRGQWATQVNATAYIAGDTGGFFNLPGGPVGFSVGGEYRREDARSYQDPVTSSGRTFLNPAATFDPPAVNIKEAFGEVRLPLLANFFAVHELTAEGAVRVSDYGGSTGSVVAWNAGLIWAPVRDIRFRGTYSRSVRAPNLSNLYATSAQTFANGLTDPCDQPGGTNNANNITTNPNRARNCAAAGVPTTVTYTDPTSGLPVTVPFTNQATSGIAGVNQGNLGLQPEIGNSFTVSSIFTPRFVPGLTIKIDYYNIRVNNVISGLTGQAIINRCYDDPSGINNVFCAAVFRRTSANQVENATFLGQTNRSINQVPFTFATSGNGVSFINQPYNFAQLKTRGIDFDAAYTKRFRENLGINVRLVASYVIDRLQYTYITEPTRYDRIDSTLGDPKWQGQFTAALDAGAFDISYNGRYVGRQIVSALSYETFFASQGRPALNPDARPFVFYDPIVYHNIRLGLNANDKKYRFYVGVDNLTNELPPYDATGTGNDAIYPNQGRFFYAGFETKF
jgi:outer membrane receptor protein involved in Fe transport